MKDFVTINDREFRVEINWNAISEFLDQRNYSLSELSNFADFSAKDINTLLYCAIQEGERMEGRKLELSMQDICSELDAGDIGQFLEIFRKHYLEKNAGSEEGGEGAKKKTLWTSRS